MPNELKPPGTYFWSLISSCVNIEETSIVNISVLSFRLLHLVLGSDYSQLAVPKLINIFTTDDCAGLAGKPKLILIQATERGIGL